MTFVAFFTAANVTLGLNTEQMQKISNKLAFLLLTGGIIQLPGSVMVV